ncbi:heat shock protein [Moniliophthora roreri]|nr:heat shock protein [Moniliophthora roreri]
MALTDTVIIMSIVFLLLVIFCCCCCRVPSRAQRHRSLRYSRCRSMPLSRDLEQGSSFYNKPMIPEKWRVSPFSDTLIQMPEPVHPPPYSRH